MSFVNLRRNNLFKTDGAGLSDVTGDGRPYYYQISSHAPKFQSLHLMMAAVPRTLHSRHFPVAFEFPSALFQSLPSKRCRNVIKHELKFYFHPDVDMILRCRRKRTLFLALIGRRDDELRYDWCRSRRLPKFATVERMALS